MELRYSHIGVWPSLLPLSTLFYPSNLTCLSNPTEMLPDGTVLFYIYFYMFWHVQHRMMGYEMWSVRLFYLTTLNTQKKTISPVKTNESAFILRSYLGIKYQSLPFVVLSSWLSRNFHTFNLRFPCFNIYLFPIVWTSAVIRTSSLGNYCIQQCFSNFNVCVISCGESC